MQPEITRVKLHNLMKEVLLLDQIEGDIKMADIETWDSLNNLILISRIEAEFNIMIQFEDFIEMTSLEKIVDVICRNLSAEPAR